MIDVGWLSEAFFEGRVRVWYMHPCVIELQEKKESRD